LVCCGCFRFGSFGRFDRTSTVIGEMETRDVSGVGAGFSFN